MTVQLRKQYCVQTEAVESHGLERQVMSTVNKVISDEDGVRRTLSQFCQYLDDRRFREWSELFVVDGEFQDLKGRSAILRYIEAGELATIPTLKRKHFVSNIVIHVRDDEATATSDLVQFDRMGDEPWAIRVGDYTDRLVRQDGRWLFASRQLKLFLPL